MALASLARRGVTDRGFRSEGPDPGGHPPVWGSPEWNASNDPQHAADLAWLTGPGYVNFLNARNAGEGREFVQGPNGGVGGPVLGDPHFSQWNNIWRPGLEFLGAAVGGAGIGSALGAGAEEGAVGGAAGAGGSAAYVPGAEDIAG